MTLDAVTARASAFLDADRPGDALRILGPALYAEPDSVELLLLASACHVALDNHHEARSDARAAVAIAPHLASCWTLLAITESRSGDHAAAREAAATALLLSPGDAASHSLVARVDVEAGAVTANSLHHAEEAVRIAPDSVDAHNTLGAVYLAKNKWRSAEFAYRDALRVDPTDEVARNDLGAAQLGRQNSGAAAAGYIDALAEKPTSELATYNLWVSAARGLWVLHVILFVSHFTGSRLFVPRYDAPSGEPYNLLRLVVPLMTTVAVIVYVLWVRRNAGSRFGLLVKSVPRVDSALGIWMALLAASFALTVTAALLPFLGAAVAQLANFACLLTAVVIVFRRWRKQKVASEGL